MLSMAEKNVQDKHDISYMTNKCQMLVFYANSLFDDEQYRRAEVCIVKMFYTLYTQS